MKISVITATPAEPLHGDFPAGVAGGTRASESAVSGVAAAARQARIVPARTDRGVGRLGPRQRLRAGLEAP